ncbi:MAG TPA: hypothetical protein VFW62_09915, partial [bacterium]|nr:hypothetical protein [bacterium]
MNVDPAAYFEQVEARFELAASRVGEIEKFFRVGGDSLRFRIAGAALADKILPALTHLQVDVPAEPDFTFLAWDSAGSGVKMLPPPWRFDHYRGKGEIPEFSDEEVWTAYQHGPDALNLWHRRHRRGIFWVRRADALPYYESGAPLRYLFQAWALQRNRQLAHGAAIGDAEGGLLITGKGGLGKSTTAASALFSPLLFAGDDYVLLDTEAPRAHSLYATAKLNTDSLDWMPELKSAIFNPDRDSDEKALLRLWPRFADRLTPSLPLKALIIPGVSREKGGGRFEPISSIQALQALAPSTLV